jgi:hypothetical protein
MSVAGSRTCSTANGYEFSIAMDCGGGMNRGSSPDFSDRNRSPSSRQPDPMIGIR